jgi:hypothetical protein
MEPWGTTSTRIWQMADRFQGLGRGIANRYFLPASQRQFRADGFVHRILDEFREPLNQGKRLVQYERPRRMARLLFPRLL